MLSLQITVDTGGPLQQALPEIFPLSPLTGARLLDTYPQLGTQYGEGSLKNLFFIYFFGLLSDFI